MINSFQRYLQDFTIWTFAIPTILLLILGSITYGLGDVIPQLNFGLLLSISLISMFSTWIMASTRIRGIIAISISLLFAIPIVLIRAGGLETQLMNTLNAFFGSISNAVFQSSGSGENSLSNLTSIRGLTQDLFANIGTLLNRSGDWMASVALGKPVFDPLVTVLVWGFVVWAVTFWAAWMIRREKNPLLGVLPAGSLLAISLSYTLAKPAALIAMLGVTLLFLGVIQQSSLEKRWRASDINVHLDVRRLSLFLVAILSTSMVIVAALTPSISIQDIVDLGKRWTSGTSEDSEGYAESLGLSSKPRRERTAIDNVRVSGLPQEHLLGSGPELSEKVVLQVHTLEGTLPIYYWRSVTYDQYTGNGWLTSGTNTAPFEAGQLVTTTKRHFQRQLSQEVSVVGPAGRLLFVSGTLVSVDQDFSLSQRSNKDIFGGSIETSSYQVNSLLPVFNENELQKTGTDYPEWIQKRYLPLPENLPQRVRDLAQQLTATVQTPYERAVVLETYLRDFPYSLEVPAASRYRDIADYFLFDLQRGYCGYYATSMVVLARAAGLPARLVIGYASNNYDTESRSYIVTQADSHAWVEVYFQEYGWVEFEPTPNRPPIPRLQEPLDADPSLQDELIQSPGLLDLGNIQINLTLQDLWSSILNVLTIVLLSCMVGMVAWIRIDTWRIRRMSPVLSIELFYLRLKSFARHLEVPFQPGDTPYEFFSRFTQHIDQEYRHGPPITDFFQSVRTLVNFYVQANYTPHSPTSEEAKTFIAAWGKIRFQMIRFWLNKRGEKIVRHRLGRGDKDSPHQS
jgi:transglutaminase-like putative cysteine protease